jgi:hypothetical protein
VDPAYVSRVAGRFGLHALEEAEMEEAHALAARLIGPGIAGAQAFVALQRAAVAAVFGAREEGVLTALLSAFPLNAGGLMRLEEGSFDAMNLDLAMLAAPGELPAAYYGWGFAAATKDGARAVVKASLEIHRQLYWGVPTYARAVTADGARALASIGFAPARSGEGMFVIPPLSIVPGAGL